ncbi:MAG TPA: hypothetical protein VJS88_07255 [Chthoniobacterales bacterium]|nr:hypothetical protein [Chthoniobacterales bacterium]
MAGLFAPKKKTNAAEPMRADAHIRPRAHGILDRTDGAKARGMKHAGPRQQHCVKYLRRAGDAREPFQTPDREGKN